MKAQSQFLGATGEGTNLGDNNFLNKSLSFALMDTRGGVDLQFVSEAKALAGDSATVHRFDAHVAKRAPEIKTVATARGIKPVTGGMM